MFRINDYHKHTHIDSLPNSWKGAQMSFTVGSFYSYAIICECAIVQQQQQKQKRKTSVIDGDDELCRMDGWMK